MHIQHGSTSPVVSQQMIDTAREANLQIIFVVCSSSDGASHDTELQFATMAPRRRELLDLEDRNLCVVERVVSSVNRLNGMDCPIFVNQAISNSLNKPVRWG